MITITPETRILRGYDHTILVKLTTDGTVASPVALTSTVTAVLVTNDRSDAISSVVTCLSSNTGADWPAGVVAVVLSNAVTEALPESPCGLELCVETVGGVKTPWFVSGLSVVTGHL